MNERSDFLKHYKKCLLADSERQMKLYLDSNYDSVFQGSLNEIVREALHKMLGAYTACLWLGDSSDSDELSEIYDQLDSALEELEMVYTKIRAKYKYGRNE